MNRYSIKKERQILDLYHELKREIIRVHKNIKGPFAIVQEYAKTLPVDKREILYAICDFRNHAAFDSKPPIIPDNYQAWIELLKDEISKLKEIK